MKKYHIEDKKDIKLTEVEFLFVVEGKDDVNFVETFLKSLNADNEKVGVISVNGKENFEEEINLLNKLLIGNGKKLKKLIIISDADEDPKNTIQKIKNSLSISTIINGDFVNMMGCEIGYFSFPDASNEGDLEKLCLSTKQSVDEELISKIEDLINFSKENLRNKLNGSIYKRKSQIYLACKSKNLINGVGFALKNDIFDINHADFEKIKKFIEKGISK